MLVLAILATTELLAQPTTAGPVPQQAGWPVAVGEASVGPPICVDLDLDGENEVVAAFRGWVYVFEPSGTIKLGWPQVAVMHPTGVPWPLETDDRIWVGNLDGAGSLEIVVKVRNESIYSAFHADGTQVSGWPLTIGADLGVETTDGLACLADLDGNGSDELIAAAGAYAPLSPAAIFAYGGDGAAVTGWPTVIAEPIIALAAGDVDFDGSTEIFVSTAQWSGGWTDSPCYLLNADGTTRSGWPRLPWGPGVKIIAGPVIADLEGDLECEILGSWQALRGFRADGSMAISPVIAPVSSNRLALADLDLDGYPEVIIAGESLTVYDPEDGSVYSENTPSVNFNGVAVGDLDGDGTPEIVAVSSFDETDDQQRLHVFDHDLQPWPGWPLIIPGYHDYNTRFISLADLDQDGDLEILQAVNWAPASYLYAWDIPNPGAAPATSEWPMAGRDPTRGSFYHLGAIPDPAFVRGDGNRDGQLGLDDAVSSLMYQFGWAEQTCPRQLDVDGDDLVTVGDAVLLLGMLFLEVPMDIPAPFPECAAAPEPGTLECVVQPVRDAPLSSSDSQVRPSRSARFVAAVSDIPRLSFDYDGHPRLLSAAVDIADAVSCWRSSFHSRHCGHTPLRRCGRYR